MHWRNPFFETMVGGLILVLASIVGCGGGAGLGKVHGKVVAEGQPVTAGTVQFSPMAGATDASPAFGAIKADGTFEMATKTEADGAAIGKHTVLYTAPPDEVAEWDGYGTPPVAKVSPFKNLVPKVTEVEVKAGSNDISIELVPRT